MNSRNAIGQQVVMRLQVTRGGSDVHPIGSLRNVRKEGLALFEQTREKTVLERMIFAARNQIEDLRLEHIGAGIDVLARRNVRLWLLQKAPHSAVCFCFDDAVGTWVFDRSKHNRGDGL